MEQREFMVEAEAAGQRIIHLEIGQPSTPAPMAARRALEAQLHTQPLGYSVSLGLPELRRAAADHYARFQGLDLNWQTEVTVTSGATEALAWWGSCRICTHRAGPHLWHSDYAGLALVDTDRRVLCQGWSVCLRLRLSHRSISLWRRSD